MAGILDKLKEAVHEISAELSGESSKHTTAAVQPAEGQHRYDSFAPERVGNDVKWFVDGCGYFWAVSEALENAKESIWILDWWLSPELYLRRPPAKNHQYRLDCMLKAAAERGVKVNVIVYKEVSEALTLDSAHTKHALEALHPNIAVFRHPDHEVDGQSVESNLETSLKNLSGAKIAQLPEDILKGLYGTKEDVILYWAHHEKLLLIDGKLVFMGGLDLCFGRWDTNQHPIADAHPDDLREIVWPGQDFNNSRVADFHDVSHWKQNKLNRKTSSRMGWSDLSFCFNGPAVEDLRYHFVQRWNFIYGVKYRSLDEKRYSTLSLNSASPGIQGQEKRHHFGLHKHHHEDETSGNGPAPTGGMPCQIVRSCCRWSNGTPTEHSIVNAYISIIQNSKHFIYIENQFFVTATSDSQKPVQNKIGAAIVERVLRAARAGEKYKVIVCMPSVPSFAGDLKSSDSFETRAIMQFQYQSINRGGHSIIEEIEKTGFKAADYIRFYNLRNYDRINSSASMKETEDKSGVSYEDARAEFDDLQGAGYGADGLGTGVKADGEGQKYQRYQKAAQEICKEHKGADKWTVSDSYMLNGQDIRSVPWEDGSLAEIDAFVTEELYIHTKIMIADDQIVICGSANLNDRSQLGTHDSEIAIVVEDPTPVSSTLNGAPWTASKFAASLRRQLFRKHLGLLAPQHMEHPDANFHPVTAGGNAYDWGSREDRLVEDPLSASFETLWNTTAATNTAAFEKVFHPVPTDRVTTWDAYDAYFERYFAGKKELLDKRPSEYMYGHVVASEFAAGPEGTKQVKDELAKIRGMLVDMPLRFLEDVTMQDWGVELNDITAPVYT